MVQRARGWHPFLAERGSPAEGASGTARGPRAGHAREGQPSLGLARRNPRRGRTRASGGPLPRRTAMTAEMLVGCARSRERDRRAWGSSDLQGTHRDDVPAPWPFTARIRRVVWLVATKWRGLAGYAPAHATSWRRLRPLGPSSSWGRFTRVAPCVSRREALASARPRGVLATFPVLPAPPISCPVRRRVPPAGVATVERLRTLHAGFPLTFSLLGLSKDRPSTGIALGVHSRTRRRVLRGDTSQVFPAFRPRRFGGLVGFLLRGLPGCCTRLRSWGSACFVAGLLDSGLHRRRLASRILAPRSCPSKLFSPATAASLRSRVRVRGRAVASLRLHRGPCPPAACAAVPLRDRRRAASRPCSIAGAVSPLSHCWVGGTIAPLGLPAHRV